MEKDVLEYHFKVESTTQIPQNTSRFGGNHEKPITLG